MTAAALLLLALGLFTAAAWGRPALTFGVLVGTLLLVPSTLPVPGAPETLVTVSRLVELGSLIGLLVAAQRGRLPARALAAHVVMVPLLVYLAAIAVTGLALADPGIDPVAGAYLWLTQAEQLVFLLLGLAFGRSLPARTVLTTLGAVTAVVGVLALMEVVTGVSWANRLFRLGAPELLGTVPAGPLEVRAGELRVRVAGDFALQTGWLLAALLPAVACAAAVRLRSGSRVLGVLLLAAVPVVAAAMAFTRSRSPLVAAMVLVVVVVGLFVSTLDRGRGPAAVAASLAGAVGLLAVAPSLAARLSPSLDQGSIDVRLERLPRVLDLPTESPLRGIGLGGIANADLPGLDTSYVLTYVETGAVAASALLVAVLFAVGSVLRGLWPGPRSGSATDDVLVLATALGAGALAVSAFTMDTFQAQTSSRLTWLLVGLGLAAAEHVRGPQPLPAPQLVPERVGIVVVAAVAGLAVFALTPPHTAARYVFATVGAESDAAGVSPGSFGRTFVVSTCQLAREMAAREPWDVTSCAEEGPPGWGYLRIEARDPGTVRSAGQDVFAAARELPRLQRLRVGPPAEGAVVGKPSFARVAPVVLPLLAASAALLLPAGRRRASVPAHR